MTIQEARAVATEVARNDPAEVAVFWTDGNQWAVHSQDDGPGPTWALAWLQVSHHFLTVAGPADVTTVLEGLAIGVSTGDLQGHMVAEAGADADGNMVDLHFRAAA